MAANHPAIDNIVQHIGGLILGHPIRVAVDGRTASGKTTFADALAAKAKASGRRVIRASIDSFHRPRTERYRQGRMSANGYYEDAHDLNAMRQLLLDPLGPGGDCEFVAASFDMQRDEPLVRARDRTPEEAVLIVDGEFLQRPELKAAWDLIILLDVSADKARRRFVERDAFVLGGALTASMLYDQRYGPAFVRYVSECRPAERADFVI